MAWAICAGVRDAMTKVAVAAALIGMAATGTAVPARGARAHTRCAAR